MTRGNGYKLDKFTFKDEIGRNRLVEWKTRQALSVNTKKLEIGEISGSG